MPELGSAAGPCPALSRGDDRRRVSLGSAICFLLESRTGLDVSGSWGRSGPGGEGGGNPKTFTFLCKDAVEQLQIHLQLAPHPLLPRPSLAGKLFYHPSCSALPGDAPLSQFLHPDLIAKITGMEQNKSGLPLRRL